MAELKTKPNKKSVAEFISDIQDESRRNDCKKLLKIMKEATKQKPVMWGESIVGFGSYHYKYSSGREGDWFITGFSPRKNDLTIYIIAGLVNYGSLLKKIGKFKNGKSCLYVKRLDDLDTEVLSELIKISAERLNKGLPPVY